MVKSTCSVQSDGKTIHPKSPYSSSNRRRSPSGYLFSPKILSPAVMPTTLSSAFEQESIVSAMSDLNSDQSPPQCATPPPIAHPFLLRFYGSAKGNPGPAGSRSVFTFYDHVIDGVADIIWSDAYMYELPTSDTNNVADYTRLIRCQREKLGHFHIEGISCSLSNR
jgi:hypothetical protein